MLVFVLSTVKQNFLTFSESGHAGPLITYHTLGVGEFRTRLFCITFTAKKDRTQVSLQMEVYNHRPRHLKTSNKALGMLDLLTEMLHTKQKRL